MKMGGLICIRNGFKLDYCFREAILSLLPICDEVLLCDCDSTDGTREFLDALSKKNPKIIVANFPWTDPKGSTEWYPEWINYGRQHLSTDYFIHLDADEVLFDADHELVLKLARDKSVSFCKRLNFWRTPKHLIPEGHCCGHKVLRMAPTKMPIPSDYPYEPAKDTMALAQDSNVRIGHYGFLRHREQFFIKAREVQRIWVNDYDPRLEKAEAYSGNWSEMPGITGWENSLVDYNGPHPKLIKGWLAERGHTI